VYVCLFPEKQQNLILYFSAFFLFAQSQVYKTGLDSFLHKKNTDTKPRVFIDLIKRFPELGWQLVEPLTTGIEVRLVFVRG
jgi:hypothetical protein